MTKVPPLIHNNRQSIRMSESMDSDYENSFQFMHKKQSIMPLSLSKIVRDESVIVNDE